MDARILLVTLLGLGVGALHAVSGPDHLLSLAPLSVGQRRGAWRVGLLWGIGHSLGTIVAALVLILALSTLHLAWVDRWADGVAGLALFGMGVWGLKRRQLNAESQAAIRSILTVGLIHGITGAAALLMILPAAVSGSAVQQVFYLGGFSVGSTVAMAALTAGISFFSRSAKVPSKLASFVPRVASALSMALGGVWMAGSL